MRLAFAGTPELACTVLSALIRAPRYDVAGVITQPDRPTGRSRSTLEPPPVKTLAEEHGVDVLQPEYLTDPSVEDWLVVHRLDAVIVAAYGKIVPARLLDIPEHGFINLHASLLPRWRGAAPVARAVLAGDAETGVCVMQMDEGMDTGPVWACEHTGIGMDETAGELTDRLAHLGAYLLLRTLGDIEDGRLTEPAPQAEEGTTMAEKLTPEEARLDWTDASWDLHRKVMAANPWPGATLDTRVGQLKVWRTRVGAGGAPEDPGCALGGDLAGGEVIAVDPELVVTAGDRPLTLLEVQAPGKKKMSGAEFARGRHLEVGDILAVGDHLAGGD